ncbi:carboxylesterase SOBER1-like [Coregonus clupeaformis]|uniref:carboxylesterase SOBER1-like n=1 Tax=Coregonus clupeaformis TaxID=59861 RepID=UPI001BE0511D|nr:carboxylesterase SOBER1-like [Coregonus clupeaformis]
MDHVNRSFPSQCGSGQHDSVERGRTHPCGGLCPMCGLTDTRSHGTVWSTWSLSTPWPTPWKRLYRRRLWRRGLFQGHGTGDKLVFHKWGEETTALLKKAGMTTTFHSFPGLQHQLSRPEIELLRSWILTKLLPDSLDASGH